MNFKNCLILVASISAANATALRGADRRELAMWTNKNICQKVGSGVYETRKASPFAASISLFMGTAAMGTCATVCNTLCTGYPSFDASDAACKCVEAVAKTAKKCGTNAELTDDASSCQCLPGYEGDALTACTEVDECASSATHSCKSNQICTNTAGSYTCQPALCANPFGNPCGPGSACTDTDSGFTCAATNTQSCPAGCGPDSQCVQGATGGFNCECNSGFYRKETYLGCVAGP